MQFGCHKHKIKEVRVYKVDVFNLVFDVKRTPIFECVSLSLNLRTNAKKTCVEKNWKTC